MEKDKSAVKDIIISSSFFSRYFSFQGEQEKNKIMKLYNHTANIKAGLFILGVSLVVGLLAYTQRLVNNLREDNKKIIFNKIKFINIKKKDFNNIIKQKGLFVFPSGPGLATIENEFKYLESLRNSDYVFFDSGYLVILLKILTIFLYNYSIQKLI